MSATPLSSAYPTPVGVSLTASDAFGQVAGFKAVPCNSRLGRVQVDVTSLLNCTDPDLPVELFVYVFAIVNNQVAGERCRARSCMSGFGTSFPVGGFALRRLGGQGSGRQESSSRRG